MIHIYHLIPAYVHHQLAPEQSRRLLLHVKICPDCRAALDRQQALAVDLDDLVADLTVTMPMIGRPRRGQLSRLWPSIWAEFRRPRVDMWRQLSSYSLAIMMLVMCVFAASALFAAPTHAIAAPFQAAPADIKPTPTLVRTDLPVLQGDSLPLASETASGWNVLPMMSPVPLAGSNIVHFER